VRLPVAEVVASVGEPLRAEVVVAAGDLSVQRWSLPSASHSELATTRPYWCGGSSYLQSRDGARTLLEGGCNTFAFCKVLLSTIYQAVYHLSLLCVV
jgi:hypothetical protein